MGSKDEVGELTIVRQPNEAAFLFGGAPEDKPDPLPPGRASEGAGR